MKDEDSELSNEELLRYLNHKIRTPLSFVLNELELLKLSGNVEAETSIKKAHEIVRTLKTASELVGYRSVTNEADMSTAEIAKEAIRNLPNASYDSQNSSPSTMKGVPAQIFTAFKELITIFSTDSKTTSIAVASVTGGIKTVVTLREAISLDSQVSLQGLMKALELADSTLVRLIDNAFNENGLTCTINCTEPSSITLLLKGT